MNKLKLSDKAKAVMAFFVPVLVMGLTAAITGELDRELLATAVGTAITSAAGVYLVENKPEVKGPKKPL